MFHGQLSQLMAISLFAHVLRLPAAIEAGHTPCLPNLRGCTELKAKISKEQPASWGLQMPRALPMRSLRGNSYSTTPAISGTMYRIYFKKQTLCFVSVDGIRRSHLELLKKIILNNVFQRKVLASRTGRYYG